MKTAKEMFEELYFSNFNYFLNSIVITNNDDKQTFILFDLDCQTVELSNLDIIEIPLLKAINKQCQEFGWLDE